VVPVEPAVALGHDHRPFLIGVAGGTCSGKTTVAERLCEMIGGDRIALIKLDSYYVDMPDEPLDVRAKANYDHPDSFDWALLTEHLRALAAGEPIEVPVYDYAAYERTPRVTRIGRCDVVVVEGILVLYEPAVRELFDLKLYVDADADLRLIRRLQRDVTERGRTPESIIDQYLATVRPSHLQFIEPSKRHADVIFPEGGRNEPALRILLARVRELLNVR
jgi:uridine kinase